MASSLTKYLMVTNFRKNPRGSGFYCVEMTWNDPYYSKTCTMDIGIKLKGKKNVYFLYLGADSKVQLVKLGEKL